MLIHNVVVVECALLRQILYLSDLVPSRLRLTATQPSKRAIGLLETLRRKPTVSARTVDRFASSMAGGRTGGLSEKWAGVWGSGRLLSGMWRRRKGVVHRDRNILRGPRDSERAERHSFSSRMSTLIVVLAASSTNPPSRTDVLV